MATIHILLSLPLLPRTHTISHGFDFMEEDTHDILFDCAATAWEYVLKKSMMSAQAIVMPRNDTAPGGLEWLKKFKFPSSTSPTGPRSQTLAPEVAAGLFESVLLEVQAGLTRAALAQIRPESTSPAHDAPTIEAADPAEHAYVAFKEAMVVLTHPPGFIGGANTQAHRSNMLVNTDWVAGFRDFKKTRVVLLEKMTPELRSFIAGAPVDVSGMPKYIQDAVEARFEVDFMDLKLLFIQAFIFWRKSGLKSTASVLKSVKTGTDCLEGQGKRPAN